MKSHLSRHIQFAGIICLLSVVTTVGIHFFFKFTPASFEESLLLPKDIVYLMSKWWIIVHCLLVMASMWGVALVQSKKSMALTGLGFVFYTVFSIAEIFRQFLVILYYNGLRVRYLVAEDETVKTILKVNIENFASFSNALFALFILGFGLGNLCYGLSLSSEKGFTRVVGILLLIWAVGCCLSLGNEFWEHQGLSTILAFYSLWFQPAVRIVVGIWLLKSANTERQLERSLS